MGNGDMGSSIHPRQDPVDHVLVVLMYLCLIQDDAAMTKHGGVECERLAALPTDVRVRVNVNVTCTCARVPPFDPGRCGRGERQGRST
jgi:hypothetical protein